MSYASQGSVDGTLTRADRLAPFAIGEPDEEPLPAKHLRRLPVDWNGMEWSAIDPETGEVLETGVVVDEKTVG